MYRDRIAGIDRHRSLGRDRNGQIHDRGRQAYRQTCIQIHKATDRRGQTDTNRQTGRRDRQTAHRRRRTDRRTWGGGQRLRYRQTDRQSEIEMQRTYMGKQIQTDRR